MNGYNDGIRYISTIDVISKKKEGDCNETHTITKKGTHTGTLAHNTHTTTTTRSEKHWTDGGAAGRK